MRSTSSFHFHLLADVEIAEDDSGLDTLSYGAMTPSLCQSCTHFASWHLEIYGLIEEEILPVATVTHCVECGHCDQCELQIGGRYDTCS